MSAVLEASGGRVGLRDDVTIVPVGGLDKVATFVALLGASGLELAVLHDYRGVPEQKLTDLVREKMIGAKAILNVSQFRYVDNLGVAGGPADIEDLFGAVSLFGVLQFRIRVNLRRDIAEGGETSGGGSDS